MIVNYFTKIKGIAFIVIPFLFSCSETQDKEELSSVKMDEINIESYSVSEIKELTDEEYPNNPDISIRSNLDGIFSHNGISIIKNDENDYSFQILPGNNNSDTIIFDSIKLLEWIPSVPSWVKKDEYLTGISIVNQEWNRMQVNFKEGQFKVRGSNLESKSLTRIDLARNCINAYLWELIFYTEEEGKSKPCYHGWFNFPKDLYASLFEKKNELNYERYRPVMEEWIDPDSKPVNLSLLRKVINENECNTLVLNNEFYPKEGERKKKAINIMTPHTYNSMNDFLVDSTVFATFSAPGFYNQKEPRKTELGRLKNLHKSYVRNVESSNTNKDKCIELELVFKDEDRTTRLIIGGVKREALKVLAVKEVNKGFQMPMGIANHSFYTNYTGIKANPQMESAYYGFLLDSNNNWLDSHTIGIDGPMMHIDEKDSNKLHVWLLSFERHCFVGHFVLDISAKIVL